jgi:5-methyltetrahydropteroyltriglutamate--homocysteine methyltransferase
MATRAPFLTQPYGAYYHRDVPHEDEERTHVGPGTPCDEYLRRFWQPVALSTRVQDLSLRVRLLGENWSCSVIRAGREDYRKEATLRVEALNHALTGIPADRIRHHVCWGSWKGPHTVDIPLKDALEIILRVKAQAHSIEAANMRHEHEWKVWQDVRLPDGKILIPGVIAHATNLVEHPELVADRLVRYASLVGRENVIAGTDCGLGGRLHPEIVWAKFQAMAEGARLASEQLWRR